MRAHRLKHLSERVNIFPLINGWWRGVNWCYHPIYQPRVKLSTKHPRVQKEKETKGKAPQSGAYGRLARDGIMSCRLFAKLSYRHGARHDIIPSFAFWANKDGTLCKSPAKSHFLPKPSRNPATRGASKGERKRGEDWGERAKQLRGCHLPPVRTLLIFS